MARYSSKSGEVPAKKGADKRFEVEAGKLPKKPRSGIDGIYGGRSHPKEMVAEDQHEPQLLGESKKPLRAANYDNDVKDGWLRGSGENATSKPGFDHSTPKKTAGGAKNTASGADIKASPFSAASKTYEGK